MLLKEISDCTRSQKTFLGSTFTTHKGGMLTVTGCLQEKGKSGEAIFKVECSLCGQDTELYPEGFKSTKSSLIRGQIPCGCSSRPVRTEYQYRVLVERECNSRGYTFLGWCGDFKGIDNTKVRLHNKRNDNYWSSTSINGLLNNSRGCPLEGNHNSAKAKRTPIEDVISKLILLCGAEGHTFVSLLEYKNQYSKFKWVCSEGHYCETSVNKFSTGRRCKECRDLKVTYNNKLGYYKERLHETDYLYIHKIEGLPYIKVGRSFQPDRRLKENQKAVDNHYGKGKYKVVQTKIFKNSHKVIYELEQAILFKEFSLYLVGSGDGYGSSELLYKECCTEVVEFVLSRVDKTGKTWDNSVTVDNKR